MKKLKKEKEAETLILGIGNPILSDDSAGLLIVDKIKELLINNTSIDTYKAATAGIDILDIVSGYDKLILIDTIKTGNDEIGTLRKHSITDFNTNIHLLAPHQLNLPTVILLAKKMGIPIPTMIDIFTVEVRDIYTISEECSMLLKDKIPSIAEEIIKESGLE